ncbi:MAG: hydantoinase/carbamoylase family amidase, partial [Solirubrobacteraceae bacterium]
MTDAATVLERCARLGEVSEEPGLLVRPFGTPAMERANALVGGWMREAGLDVREDAVRNLIGRRDTLPARPAFVLGSHLDTVRDAGRYDGPLGVLVALAAVERAQTPFAVEVVGFADEEGLRFGTAYLGSSAMAGRPLPLDARDADGVRLGDLVPDPAPAARSAADLLGYCEVHIEQGPVLERRGVPVGVVTAITGQTHAVVRIEGEAGHAGTVPMAGRRDALCAAAEAVLAAEEVAARGDVAADDDPIVAAGDDPIVAAGDDGVVATVGRLAVEPGARNVIPAAVTLSVDLRHGDDAVRR